jgi:hypothetical protein
MFVGGSSFLWNCIGGVMYSALASSAVDHGFESRSGKTKDYKIGICCFSAKHTALRRKSKATDAVPKKRRSSNKHVILIKIVCVTVWNFDDDHENTKCKIF